MNAYFYNPLVGIYRHHYFCKEGKYRVVPCLGDLVWPFDAVVDDFGNLVRVS